MRQRLGDPETGLMSEEQLLAHRELQALRAAGLASSRRRQHGRAARGFSRTPEQMDGWVEERYAKLQDAERAYGGTG